MSKLTAEELDLRIRLSLIARIRQAGHVYKAAPPETGSPALQSYVAALECLAEHIDARTRKECRGTGPSLATAVPTHQLRVRYPLPEPVKAATGRRVIPFPVTNGASPFTAA